MSKHVVILYESYFYISLIWGVLLLLSINLYEHGVNSFNSKWLQDIQRKVSTYLGQIACL